MPRKKRSTVGHRRKNKSNTTTTPNNAAKRSKIEEKNPVEYRNGILQGITALLGKMDDKDLLAIMAHVVSASVEETKPTTLQPAVAVTTTATGEEAKATATVTATVNSTTTANPTDQQQQH